MAKIRIKIMTINPLLPGLIMSIQKKKKKKKLELLYQQKEFIAI